MADEEFWSRYLRQHSRPATRAVHVTATAIAVLLAAGALFTLDWRLAVAAPIVGYGGAWFSHAFIERNRPETFSRPLRSFVCDLRMTWLYLTGRLRRELDRYGLE